MSISSEKGIAGPLPAGKRGAWARLGAVVLVVLGLHVWHSRCDGEVLEPFSNIPAGGAGAVSLTSCGEGLECGYINVPKDYFNASAGLAHVAFARSKAPKQPAKGSVMLNPGGPGGSGIEMVMEEGQSLRRLLGDQWDLIGFDPRGIGRTRPLTKCFPNAEAQELLYSNTVFQQAYTVPNIANLSDPLNRPALAAQARQLLAIKEAQAQLCAENMDVEDLRYMGTATVVRDMDFMTRAFDGEDAKIQYFGGSYGSILGQYLVNMLPHRIGRATIDGIVDADSWANEPSHRWHKTWTSSAEDTYQWFLRDCAASGPARCALASHANEDPSAIMARIETFLHGLVARPLAGTAGGKPGYLTSGGARGALFFGLVFPPIWPDTALALADAMAGNATRALALVLGSPEARTHGADLSRLGVTCADSPAAPAPAPEDIADELLAGLAHSSAHFGASPVFTEPDGGCEFWPARGRAAERFAGPWNASLEYPLLIVSNTADPLTPIASGRKANQRMPHSSRLLVHDGPGHGMFGLPSMCALKAVHAYWQGSPPANGTFCAWEGKSAFPGAADELAAEDHELLRAARAIGRAMQPHAARRA